MPSHGIQNLRTIWKESLLSSLHERRHSIHHESFAKVTIIVIVLTNIKAVTDILQQVLIFHLLFIKGY